MHYLRNFGVVKGLGALVLLFVFAAPQFALAESEDISARLEALEEELLELQLKQSEKTPVTAFDSMRLDFGGFITQTFTSVFNGDGPSRSSFDQTNLEFLIGADVTERDSFFAAIGFLRQADLINEGSASDVNGRRFAAHANRIPGIIMWGKHDFDQLLDVTYGRMITPWGIINREHFPPVLLNLNQPQYLRNVQPGNLFGGNTFIPNFVDGVQAHGSKFYGDHQAEYFTYITNFDGAGADAADLISGARLQWTLPNNLASIGGSYQNGARAGAGAQKAHYDAWGLDVLVNYKGFQLKTEYIRTNERGGTSTNGNASIAGKESWYIQPAYTTGKTIVFYRWDVIDTNLDIGNDASQQTEHVFGVNYLWAPTIRLRAEYVLNRFDLKKDTSGNDRAYDNIQLSITTSF
jgi:hypothetical protein